MPYILEPEVAGGWGKNTVADTSCHPPKIVKLAYQFDGWSGDELLTSFPCFIVTKRLAEMLESSSLNGYELAPVEITKSEVFCELYPNHQLPEFKWLKVIGTAPTDDFFMNSAYQLVVSEAALKLLSCAQLTQCEVELC